jgi:hypothetical protein
MKAAAKAGIETLILDGITPEWNGVGGCLELVDADRGGEVPRQLPGAAWNEVTPRHRKFVDKRCSPTPAI